MINDRWKSPVSRIERNPNALSPLPRAMAHVKSMFGIGVKKAMAHVKSVFGIGVKKGDVSYQKCLRNRGKKRLKFTRVCGMLIHSGIMREFVIRLKYLKYFDFEWRKCVRI